MRHDSKRRGASVRTRASAFGADGNDRAAGFGENGAEIIRAGSARNARTSHTSRILLVVGIALIAAALIIALSLLGRYLSARATYDSLEQAAGLSPDSNQSVSQPSFDAGENLGNINWDALRQINPDIVAWITIEGTRISYPIAQAPDNEYYLNHLFDKTSSTVGSVFLDCDNVAPLATYNTMIYGHNMLDGSMFADLLKFREQGFFDEHRTVRIATPDRVWRLQTLAVVVCEGDEQLRQLDFASDAAFTSYLDELLRYATISDAPSVGRIDRLCCLVTCTDLGNTKRLILLAAPVEEAAAQGDAAQAAQTNAAQTAQGDTAQAAQTAQGAQGDAAQAAQGDAAQSAQTTAAQTAQTAQTTAGQATGDA
ncbi:MAG: class B sortase [Coriobacteriales bacterium]|nr:class B sortase [Coriobacteriales bacterium]